MNAFTIARRELLTLFLSPLAWAMLGVVQLIGAWVFLKQLQEFMGLQAQLSQLPGSPGATEVVVVPLYATLAIVLMLLVPLLTMRLVSEERRAGTLPLLMSAPVSMSEIVLGKYLGVVGFLLLMLGLLSLMPGVLWLSGGLDGGLWMAVLIGLALLVGAFAALGLYFSTLTAQPTVAAVSTFGTLLLLWLLDWAGGQDPAATDLLSYLSLLRHFDSFSRGLFSSADALYYLLFILVFIVLSVRRLDAHRLQG